MSSRLGPIWIGERSIARKLLSLPAQYSKKLAQHRRAIASSNWTFYSAALSAWIHTCRECCQQCRKALLIDLFEWPRNSSGLQWFPFFNVELSLCYSFIFIFFVFCLSSTDLKGAFFYCYSSWNYLLLISSYAAILSSFFFPWMSEFMLFNKYLLKNNSIE